MSMYLKILKVNLVNSFQRDTAYFSSNWTAVLSTLLFTITQIIMVEFLFGNITEIASFTKNDIYFFMMVAQTAFYLQVMISYDGATALSSDVNSGAMDFTFLRPIPQRWYIYTKSISFVMQAFQAIPALLPIIIIINWSAISVEPINLLAGIAIFIMGFIIDNTLIYMLALTSFWTGSADFTLNYFWAERNETKVPFENLFTWFKVVIYLFTPAFITSALTTSVILGFSSAAVWVPITFVAMLGWMLFGNYMWKRAFLQYSSASS